MSLMLCSDCGEDATTTAPVYTGPNTYIDEALCADCARVRENREPPDMDGEDIFRDYQAEARDQMIAAQRLK